MESLRISELAKRAGVSTTTIRYYEEIGVLTPARRGSNGYREYDERDVDRLAVINRAKGLDIALDDVRALVSAWDADQCATVQHNLGDLVSVRLEETERRIADLTSFAEQLRAVGDQLASATTPVGGCGSGCVCATAPAIAPATVPAGRRLLRVNGAGGSVRKGR
jgi:DNA-binding transcriptional MerR regulator